MFAQTNVKKEKKSQEEKKQEYLEICEQIVPTISECIDTRGGFCSISELQKDENVIEALQSIPEGFSKKIMAIINLYPGFISCFEGGRVATAKGYEEGYVNMDGTVNQEAKKASKKAEVQAQVAIAEEEAAKEKAAEKGLPNNSGAVLKMLKDAFSNGTDEEFEAACEQARIFRQNHSPEAIEHAKATIAHSVQTLIEAGKKPTLNLVTSLDAIVALAPVIGRKLKKFIEDNPMNFSLTKEPHPTNPDHLEYVVELNPSYIYSTPQTSVPLLSSMVMGGRKFGMVGTHQAPQAQVPQTGMGMMNTPQAYQRPVPPQAQAGGHKKGIKGGKGKGGYEQAPKRHRIA